MRFTAALCVLTILRYVAAATAGTLRVAQNKPSVIADIDFRNLQFDNSNTSALFIYDYVNTIALGQPLVFAVRSDFDGDANVTMGFQVSHSNVIYPGVIFNETKPFRFYKGMNYLVVESYPPDFWYYVATWTIESPKLASPFKQITARYMNYEPKLEFRYITEPDSQRKVEFTCYFYNMSDFDTRAYAYVNISGWPSNVGPVQLIELEGSRYIGFGTIIDDPTALDRKWRLYNNADLLRRNEYHNPVSKFKFSAPEHSKTPGSAALTARLGYGFEKDQLKLIYTDYKPANHLSFVVPNVATKLHVL